MATGISISDDGGMRGRALLSVGILILLALVFVAARQPIVSSDTQSPAPPAAPVTAPVTGAQPSIPAPDPAATSAPPAPGEVITTTLTGEIRVDGSGPWQSYFGAPASRTVEVTLTNDGNTVVTPSVILSFGPGEERDGVVVRRETLAPLPPGESVTLTAPVETRPVPFGRYTAFAVVAGAGQALELSAPTSTYPWGLLLLLWLLIQIPLLGLYKRRPVVYESAVRPTAPTTTHQPTEPDAELHDLLLGEPVRTPPEPPPGYELLTPPTTSTPPAMGVNDLRRMIP